MKRSSRPSALASRAKPMISRVPSTLICRASSSGRSNEIEAAQCITAPASSATAARSARVHAQAGRGDVAGDRARAAEVRRRVAPELGHDALQALLRPPRCRPRARGTITSRSPFSSRRAMHLHAEEARRARQEDRRASRLDLFAHRRDLRAHRVEAAVDVDDLRGDRARGVGEQEVDRLRHRRRVLDVPRQRRLLLPRGREVAEARDAARGERRQRPGATPGSRARLRGPRSRAR